MPSALTPEVAHRELTREETAAAMAALLEPGSDDTAKAAFLRAWAQRGETASELAASAETLLARAADPGVHGSWNGQPLLDCCGTGGGGLNLLNISTGIVFILAAMGIPVVKHGNRGITKKSGSADVLEALKIQISMKPDELKSCLEEVNAAFFFAPYYHPAFMTVRAVRQQLAAEGQRTIFNLLGPLLNPARPQARLVGVFKTEHVKLYHQALAAMTCPNFTVACGEDASTGIKIGEISACGPTEISSFVKNESWMPVSFRNFQSLSNATLETLFVRDAEGSAKRLRGILMGEDDVLAYDILLVNAAVAAWTQGKAKTREEGYLLAKEALDSGRALAVLRKWQDFSAKL